MCIRDSFGARTRDGGKCFISLSGINSELGEGYAVRSDPLKKRFGKLAVSMSEKHEIKEPVCLYDVNEMKILAELSGFKVEEAWASSFGNIKAILVK